MSEQFNELTSSDLRLSDLNSLELSFGLRDSLSNHPTNL